MTGTAPRPRPAHVAVLCATTLACLAPFLGKPLHIDDPLFVWTARHIQVVPSDFYGFEVNWHGFVDTMAGVNKNPPLVAFYLALVGALFGWSEIALHAGMLLPAIAAVLGVYFLALRLCPNPLVAGASALATPVFLVSASSVMVDVSMLALWCWAVALWIGGFEDDAPGRLLAAGVLVGLACLAKYAAISLLPLLFAFSIARQRRVGAWASYMLVPLAIVAAYQGFMWASYDWDPLGEVAAYALASRAGAGNGVLWKLAIGLLFLGGCFVSTLFHTPLLWSRRTLGLLAAACIPAALWLANRDAIGLLQLRDADGVRWGVVAQVVLALACALQIFALAALDIARRRDATSLLLALWLCGVFAFAAFVNWTLNARVLLPAAPAVAILVARRIADRARAPGRARPALLLALPGLAIALAVAHADARHAASARAAAAALTSRYGGAGTLWFQGGWGFQYYMEAAGARRVDAARDLLAPGDILVIPQNNTNLFPLPSAAGSRVERARFPALRWMATHNEQVGAGFHSDRWGPLPFVAGPAPDEIYDVYAIRTPLQLRGRRRGEARRSADPFEEPPHPKDGPLR